MPASTRYYDGQRATAHAVTLRWNENELCIESLSGDEDGLFPAKQTELARWPRKQLQVGEPDPDGIVTLSCKRQAGRLQVHADALPQGLHARHPHYLRWTLVSAAMMAVVFLIAVQPAILSAMVPMSVERQLGDTVSDMVQSDSARCTGAAGQQALEQLEAKLSHAAGIRHAVRVSVINRSTVNAMTLPGDRIIILRGLIDHVNNPDQLAGVMAHETGHMAARDPMTALIRSMGISFITSMIGGNYSSTAGNLVNLSYSRGMERRADAHGVAYLQAAGLRSDGLASFFALLEKREGPHDEAATFLSDHPDTAEREKLNRGSSQGAHALTDAQWQAVKTMCDSTGGDEE